MSAGPDWDGNVRISGHWLTVIVVGGVLLAAATLFALDRALIAYTESQARARLAALAHSSLGLTETRLEHATTVLVDLAAAGVEDCGAKSLAAMRLAVFSNTSVKGISILDDQGRALCTHVGALLDTYAVSREYPLTGQRLTVAAARFRDLNERALRLRLERPGGRSLSALIAVDALLPDVDLEEGVGGKRLRLMFENGEMIVARPAGDEGLGLDDGRSLVARQVSERYPIVIVAEHSRSALASEYRDLQFIARFAALALMAFGFGLFWLSTRRNHDDPVEELRRAIRAGEIVPFYQPTVDTKNGRVRGAEVLARWRKPDGTVISPAHFIPLAEQSGLIFELTRVLMRRARDEVGASYRERPRLRLSFNLFAGHLADAKVVDDVKQIFGGSPISTDQLVLEVTERAPLPDLGEARRVIEMLQKLRIKVAIDDVGTGHGGLSYLMKLGVDIIKIDKMFIDAIGTERYSQTIIETLVELGRTMNMEVIAEGVESFEQVEYLRLKGVNEAQGYVFAPPLPGSSYLALVGAMERPKLSVVPELLAQAGAA
ncbi:MAG: EAL domain-containing protein [Xanthobacteraceae bacterium]